MLIYFLEMKGLLIVLKETSHQEKKDTDPNQNSLNRRSYETNETKNQDGLVRLIRMFSHADVAQQ